MSEYTSETLFHFVGHRAPLDHAANYETLTKILRSDCVRVPPDMLGSSIRRDLSRTLSSGELVKPSMTCFADIRQKHLGIHIEKYGHFGLGLHRDVVIKFGGRPVIYVPTRGNDWSGAHGAAAIGDIEAIYRGFLQHVVEPHNYPARSSRALGKGPTSEDEAVRQMLSMFEHRFLAYLQPFDSELADEHPRNYYLEREWRCDISVRFTPRDVRHLIVHPDYLHRFAAEFSTLADRCDTSSSRP